MKIPRTNKMAIWPPLLVIGMIALLYFTREVTIPLAFALILAFVLNPVVRLLERIRLHRVPAVLLVVLVTVAVAGGVGWMIAGQVVDVAERLPEYRQNLHAKIE